MNESIKYIQFINSKLKTMYRGAVISKVERKWFIIWYTHLLCLVTLLQQLNTKHHSI